MKYKTINGGCALIKRSPMHDNRPVVLAVGGSGEETAEVYDYTQPNAEWQESKHIGFFLVLFLTSVKSAFLILTTFHILHFSCWTTN